MCCSYQRIAYLNATDLVDTDARVWNKKYFSYKFVPGYLVTSLFKGQRHRCLGTTFSRKCWLCYVGRRILKWNHTEQINSGDNRFDQIIMNTNLFNDNKQENDSTAWRQAQHEEYYSTVISVE